MWLWLSPCWSWAACWGRMSSASASWPQPTKVVDLVVQGQQSLGRSERKTSEGKKWDNKITIINPQLLCVHKMTFQPKLNSVTFLWNSSSTASMILMMRWGGFCSFLTVAMSAGLMVCRDKEQERKMCLGNVQGTWDVTSSLGTAGSRKCHTTKYNQDFLESSVQF